MFKVRTELSWRDGSQRALVMIGDAEPHGVNYPQNTLKLDWREECKLLNSQLVCRELKWCILDTEIPGIHNKNDKLIKINSTFLRNNFGVNSGNSHISNTSSVLHWFNYFIYFYGLSVFSVKDTLFKE